VNRRAFILEELGMTPLWKLRDRSVASATRDAKPSTNTVQPPETPARKIQAREAQAHPDPAVALMDWAELQTAVANCTACGLCKARKQAVLGVGDTSAQWLFVGEGPGAEEDARGEPFVGQAGKLLDNMLTSIGLKRSENVYIANVVKCRPPGNRTPEPSEAHACEPFLTRQIQLIKPRLIVALGKVAAQNLLGSDATIGSLRGRLHQHKGIPLVVMYHPAYLLRNLPDKARAWEDLCFAVDAMRSLLADPVETAGNGRT
jgi:DNA polymerase